MADELDVEVDVEGDFDFKSGLETSSLYDVNEPPSSSACLLPEFTQHPWVLDQTWALDHGMDEKSKATVEKMLQEEQYYSGGRVPHQPLAIPTSHEEESTSNQPVKSRSAVRRIWTPPEKELFEKLFDVYGRNWSSIAESIDGKTTQQVKSYGHQFLKKRKLSESQPEEEMISESEGSLEKSLAEVTTAQPTVSVTEISSRHHKPVAKVKRMKKANSPQKSNVTKAKDPLKLVESEVVRLRRASEAESEEDVDMSDVSDGEITAGDQVYQQLLAAASLSSSGLITNGEAETGSGHEEKPAPTDLAPAADEQHGGKQESPDADSHETLSEEPKADNKSRAVEMEGQEVVKSEQELTKLEESSENLEAPKNLDLINEGPHSLPEEAIPTDCYPLQKSDGEFAYLTNPECEVQLDLTKISEQEKDFLSEFFEGRPSKTPERYLRIRNYLIDTWKKMKPSYLKKTSARSGLRNCGDVNCIGRVHAYLEQIGAINFGCEQVQYKKCRLPSRTSSKKIPNTIVPKVQLPGNAPRKRRVRDMYGNWVDEKELEGRTIQHVEEQKKTKLVRNSRSYDPFKLIPCQEFNSTNPAPFRVDIEASALIAMDVHAHLSKAEVIGMLGGRYETDNNRLHIMTAHPCESISTGMQCEVDPVSQTVACERICNDQQMVLGWYHSHPTFTPNPSVRDIETQLKYQEWFSAGGSHFVGVIVSPYSRDNHRSQSQVQCLTIHQEKDRNNTKSVPYQFDFGVTYDYWNCTSVIDQLQHLAHQYHSAANHVEMLHHIRSTNNLTCLAKMLESISSLIPGEEEEVAALCDQVETVFQHAYSSVTEDLTIEAEEEP